jgi:hypothetical protein
MKERAIHKQIKGKIREWLKREQRGIKEEVNEEESNNEKKACGYGVM